MDEKNKQLVENPTSKNVLVSLHSFEAETRLACAPEYELKPIIGYRTSTYHPIDGNYKLIVSPNNETIAEQCGKAIYLIRRNTLTVYQVISLEETRTSFVFTPDSKHLIVADSKGKLSTLEVETGVCQNVIETKTESIKKIHISRDGRTLLLDARSLVELYRINTGECIGSYDSKGDLLGFGSDDQTMVRKEDHAIKITDIQAGKTLKSYDFSYISEAALSLDGNKVIVVDLLGKKTILDLKNGHQQEIQISSKFSNGSAALHSSKRYLILCNQKNEYSLELWDLEKHSKMDIPGRWEDVQICPNEEAFFAKEANKGKFTFWEIQSGKRLMDINPDGTLNVVEPEISNGHGLMITSGYQEGATLWNLKTGHDQHHFKKYSRQVFNAYFSQNDKFLLTDSWPDRINLWDTETGASLRRWHKYPYQLGLAFAPDNHLLAYMVGEEIVIENIFYEDEDLKLPIGNTQQKKIKFSDDNHSLYHFSIDPSQNCFTYAIYQAKTGKLIENYRHESSFNNDTKYDIDFAKAHIYTIDGGRIVQTNLITGEIIKTFRGPVEEFDRFLITSMAFDPNGKWVAGVYQKSHVAFWEMDGDGKPQFIIDTTTMNPNGVQNLCFMKEEVLMICSLDGVITFWDIARKNILAKLYCLSKGYLWTTPPDGFAPNGWLYTNRTDLIALTSVGEDGKVIECIDEEDPRYKDYLHIYNDQEMVMTRLNDFERYQELLKNRIQMKNQTEHKLLEVSRNDAQNLLLKAGKTEKSV